eukprot:10577668-Lingulodinium_polyedra.AAC.1
MGRNLVAICPTTTEQSSSQAIKRTIIQTINRSYNRSISQQSNVRRFVHPRSPTRASPGFLDGWNG